MPDITEDVLARRAAGESQASIAAALGVSRSQVQRIEKHASKQQSRVLVISTDPPKLAARARLSVNDDKESVSFAGKAVTEAPPDMFRDWALLMRAGLNVVKLVGHDVNSTLLRLSPEYSRAIWDWLRLLDPGHEILAFVPGTDTPHATAQTALNDFMATVDERHGSRAVLFSRLYLNAMTRGAFFAELVLDKRGRQPIDIVAPDPATVRFRRITDGDYGQVFQIGQEVKGKFVRLDYPTIRYLPLDPEPGSPYGTPMFTSAVFPALFIIGLMSDLRRVIAQQGYPRSEVIIDVEKLRLAFPNLDDNQFRTRMDEMVSQVQDVMSILGPDDAFVHADLYEYKVSAGAIDASALGGADPMTQAIERMLIRSMKTMPLTMGVTDGVSEANANRQWEIFAAGVKALQHHMEQLLDQLLTLALQVMGIQADVEVRFAEIRASEAMRDAETDLKQLEVAEKAELLGYMERDEASNYAVGHKAAGDPILMPTSGVGLNAGKDEEPSHKKEDGSDNERSIRSPVDDTPTTGATVEEDDLIAASAAWNVAMNGWSNLLDAEVDHGGS